MRYFSYAGARCLSVGFCFLILSEYTYAAPNVASIQPTTAHVVRAKTDRITDVTLTGTVSDERGDGLPGVTVAIKGTTSGSTSDANGKYTLTLRSGQESTTLVFSYVGYMTKEVAVNNQSIINVQLTPDTRELNEVVVVGYGTVRKSDLTGSVATVDTKKITQLATVDVNQALQGKVAGVQITPSSGNPGSSAKVRIRGVGTINNSDPLYVVDGYPTNSIDFISPTDIETMEVLKDASATAIYGNRGANGVILITTKKGKSGAPVFNFNTYVGVQNPWKMLPLASAAEYATLYLEAYKNDGVDVTNPAKFSAADYATLKYAIDNNAKGTDWQKEVFRKNATIQNYSFSVNGGTDKSRYGLSATWFNQEGSIRNTGLKKFFLRFNNDYTFSSRVKAGVSISYINASSNSYNGSQYDGVLPTAITTSPVTAAWDPFTNNYGVTMQFSQANSPVRIVDELKTRKNLQNKVVGNAYAEIGLLKGLSFRSTFGGELNFNKINNYYPKFYISPSEQRTVSNLYDDRQQGYQWTLSNYFTYNKEFGKHTISATLGQEAQTAYFSNVNVTGLNILNDPTQYYISSSKDPNFQAGSGAEQSSLLSFFGRVNYNYDDRYLLTATIRRDASSRFTPQNRVGIFPSFSAGWNVHREAFLQNVNWLSNLKVRAGYGVVGNQGSVSTTATRYLIDPQQRYSFGGAVVEGRANTRLQNQNLIWESSSMINAGADIGLLNNKINVTLDYFIKKTYNMIVTPPIPRYAGALAPSVNAGDMENKGLEVTLNYKNQNGPFRYDLGVNAAFIQNKVISLGGGAPISSGSVAGIGSSTRVEPGQIMAYFFGRKTDGIFHTQEEVNAYTWTDASGAKKLIQPSAKAGDVKFVDVNNDGQINDNDRINLGSALPKFTYGFNAFMEYKNFDLKIFFQGTYGNETVNGIAGWADGARGLYNSYASRMGRWTTENPTSNMPRMTTTNANNNDIFSDRFVENGSYLRLRNIQFGYTLPATLLNRIGVKAVRIYVSADNLLTFSKYRGFEPEVADLDNNPFFWGVDLTTYPQARTLLGGLNLTF